MRVQRSFFRAIVPLVTADFQCRVRSEAAKRTLLCGRASHALWSGGVMRRMRRRKYELPTSAVLCFTECGKY